MSDPVFKKDSVHQEFDLEEILGVDVSSAPEIRKAFGQAVLDHILKRTEKGLAIGGDEDLKKPYSDAYANSLAFKAAGKHKDEIDMSLNGDMMGLMDIIEEEGSRIKIGWDDEIQNLKAFNHNTGDTVPKRPFFGLTKDEIDEIASQFRDDVQNIVQERNARGPNDLTDRALRFLDSLESQDQEGE